MLRIRETSNFDSSRARMLPRRARAGCSRIIRSPFVVTQGNRGASRSCIEGTRCKCGGRGRNEALNLDHLHLAQNGGRGERNERDPLSIDATKGEFVSERRDGKGVVRAGAGGRWCASLSRLLQRSSALNRSASGRWRGRLRCGERASVAGVACHGAVRRRARAVLLSQSKRRVVLYGRGTSAELGSQNIGIVHTTKDRIPFAGYRVAKNLASWRSDVTPVKP